MINLRRVLVGVLGGLLTASAAFAGEIVLNGTCEYGNCALPDVLGSGQTTGTLFDFTYTLANTDEYLINGGVTWSNAGISLNFDASVEYLGNGSGTASQTDVLTLEFLQYYDEGSMTSGVFNESYFAYFWGPIAGTSSTTGQLSISGQSLPLLGPLHPGGSADMFSPNNVLFGLSEPLLGVWTGVYTFGAGSNAGATISDEAPEPASAVFALGGLALLVMRFRSGKQRA
ncbi:MAG TPA: hypothetical protein VKF41_10345 [Bryobacteraceae bacterium]|nr:hypothetical protein [Bryobacteraceae bacterium]